MGRTSDARERLMQVAFDLIWQASYGAVSVDQICDKAAVKKGSFYYFFPSKTELILAAYDAHWDHCRPLYDSIFSPQNPPLERVRNYVETLRENQKTAWERTGKVLGCPFACVGAELSTQNPQIRTKSMEMFDRLSRYLETALRDAHAEGLVPAMDFRVTADSIQSFIVGMLLQAKLKNDVKLLDHLWPSLVAWLRLPSTASIRTFRAR